MVESNAGYCYSICRADVLGEGTNEDADQGTIGINSISL